MLTQTQKWLKHVTLPCSHLTILPNTQFVEVPCLENDRACIQLVSSSTGKRKEKIVVQVFYQSNRKIFAKIEMS